MKSFLICGLLTLALAGYGVCDAKTHALFSVAGLNTGMRMEDGLSILESTLKINPIESCISRNKIDPTSPAWKKYGPKFQNTKIVIFENLRPIQIEILTSEENHSIAFIQAHHSKDVWIGLGEMRIMLTENYTSVLKKASPFVTSTTIDSIYCKDTNGQILELDFADQKLISAVLYKGPRSQ